MESLEYSVYMYPSNMTSECLYINSCVTRIWLVNACIFMGGVTRIYCLYASKQHD